MSVPQPFKIAVPEQKLHRLKQQLLLTELPPEIPLKDPRSRGAAHQDIRKLVDYWTHSFDWRVQEERLNQIPQFTVDIEVDGFGTYNVHFIHQKSSVANAIPLLFLHGWPGSFLEITKMLPELVQGGTDHVAFDVVAPSLIDYGFSQASRKEGFGVDQHAEAYQKLMQKLGYNEYVAQGGDIGSVLSRFLAQKYPNSCKAHHVNLQTPAPPTAETHPRILAQIEAAGGLTAKEQEGLASTQAWQVTSTAYAMMHRTRPQTIGYSLSDSPVGLLSWIYEKLCDWTDEYPWTPDEVLTWVSIYRFSRAGPAAPQHLYLEIHQRKPIPVSEQTAKYCDVPIGTSHFAKEVLRFPLAWDHTLGPVVFQAEHEKGGHFAAWECPDVLAKDLREMFDKKSPVFNCVRGKSGYA